MTRNESFNKMTKGKMVRITPFFRKYWDVENLGQWFYIQKYNSDNTVQICSNSTHQIFENIPIKEIKP